MSVLKSLETKIAGLVEGAFGRAFRSELRPVEIARKLAREMEDQKTVSISKVYVPNEYAVYVSVADRERFADYEDALSKELCGYLLEHARLEKLALLARPQVEFHTDDRLSLGEFGIQARLVKPAEDPRVAPEQGDAGHTMVFGSERLRPVEAPEPARSATALIVAEGKRMVVGTSGAVIGRSRDCDIVLSDPNVSRRHAEVTPGAGGWAISDLGSTNGVVVNGRKASGATQLNPGDRIDLGTAQLRFELE
jgi:Protein of unknown function (DUF3662)/Inner membrane component of T3SS, cytoplasmic domain